MPEYLAPGVYVEEIPSGNKPIQAASTSTAGMVGMTERGPVNRPTLVTSRGAYARIFGGKLHPDTHSEGRDALPYAAEGFFVNGGARLYVTRIVGGGASESELALAVRDTARQQEPSILVQANAGATALVLDDVTGIADGAVFLIDDGAASETVALDLSAPGIRYLTAGGLPASFPAGAAVDRVVPGADLAVSLTVDAEAGDTELAVNDSSVFAVGAAVFVSDPSNGADVPEWAHVVAVPNATTVRLAAPLAQARTQAGTEFDAGTTDAATTLAVAAAASSQPVHLATAAEAYDVADVIRLVDGDTASFVEIAEEVPVAGLAEALASSHGPGTVLRPAIEVLEVHSASPGDWGDDLRITIGESHQVETATTAVSLAGQNTVTVDVAFGLFEGSVIAFGTGERAVVADVDTGDGIVTLRDPLIAEVPVDTTVVSQEFSLLVERMEDGRAAESETFDRLSLADAHPRYAPNIVGSWDNATQTPSETGGSALIRLAFTGADAQRELPLIPVSNLMLDGGDDDAAAVTDDDYEGTASDDPAARTGIHALRNEPSISIVAVPGRTSVALQKELIAHCDAMRYRFAVLDTPLGANLGAARAHRQNFDSTRAAVYYPGLVVPNDFGNPGDRIIVPSAGHVAGIYARTDLTRGVHKAPANEVVRGILEFETALTKGEQDILNPLNLNCFRDFRTENRGLRLYGARVATSDPEWRYVNVRRLLLFIEQSLDTGLQWAVFEPNAEPLWDTVRQSIGNFLTTVWRSGALEGTKAEEAFFVNIGYDITMSQDDIDNGRLIVEVGVAPVKPAEFVIVRISQKTREATA